LFFCFFVFGACSPAALIRIEIAALPDKLIYEDGEEFDRTGMKVIAVYDDGSAKEISLYSVDKEILTVTDTTITVSYKGFTVQFSITVRTSETDEGAYKKVKPVLTLKSDKIIAVYQYYREDIVYQNKIANPCPEGIAHSREEFLKYCEYNAFYYIKEFPTIIDYPITDIQKELDYVYWNSNFFAGSIGLDATPSGENTYRIVLRYYGENKYNTDSIDLPVQNPVITSLAAVTVTEKRSNDFVFAYQKLGNQVDVYNSSQLEYALENGYGVNIIKDSPADILMTKVESVLKAILSDNMTEIQKLRQIYSWITKHAIYDYSGDDFSGTVSDAVKNCDEYASQFASFYADGVILYGTGVCHGFARAYNIMMLTEGIKTVRVLGKRDESQGRSPILFMQGKNTYYSHGYNYVTIEGKQYLSDITYAYAGTIMADTAETGFFRNCALLISKQIHARLYIRMTDPVSSDSSYINNFYDYLQENHLENIPNTLAIGYNYTEMVNELENHYSDQAYVFHFIVNSSNYSTIRSQLSQALSGFGILLSSSPYTEGKNVIICLIY
jgi:hypothetical protein